MFSTTVVLDSEMVRYTYPVVGEISSNIMDCLALLASWNFWSVVGKLVFLSFENGTCVPCFRGFKTSSLVPRPIHASGRSKVENVFLGSATGKYLHWVGNWNMALLYLQYLLGCHHSAR